MKATERVIRETVYSSDVLPDVRTTHKGLAEIIAWADANPVVWKIVTQTKSAPFGKSSSFYMGCVQKSDAPSAILDRASAFYGALRQPDGASFRNDFWRWRADFTMKHYGEKGFRGGFFQQWDGNYNRGCTHLDYTPEMRSEILERFRAWCDSSSCRYETQAIKIDGTVVWEIAP